MKNKTKLFSQRLDDINNNVGIVMPILTECDSDEDFSEGLEKVGEELPILALRNMVLFPGTALPVLIGRSKSMRLVKEAMHKKSLVGVVCQRDVDIEDPGMEDLYPVGVVGEIVRILEMPDEMTTIILQGKRRFRLNELTETEPYLKGRIELMEDKKPDKGDREFEALISTIKDLTIKLLGASMEPPRDLVMSIRNNKNNVYTVNFSCSNIPVNASEKQQLLEIDDMKERAYRLLFLLNREYQLVELKAAIQMKTHEDIDQQQKEYFLQQQIKTIQEELGGNINEQEIQSLREKAATKKWSAEVAAIFEKEVKRLERVHPQSPDYSVQAQYVQTIVNLPWNEYSKDNFNLTHAQKVLDRDHYGLEKVKERIIEHLAVLKLKGDMKSPIICLYGPPGVGKTSLGRSVAEALNRKYVRVSLGGLHDEAEIRGHRRTYIGAMPGRVIQNIQKAGTSNPVFVLDEIDKITNDFKGDPAAALLEVLDPEHSGINLFDSDWKIYSRNSGMTGHRICRGATVENSMITDGCHVEGNVKHSILFAGVRVEAGAKVEDAVVMGGTVIKAGAVVEHCIVAENVVIGENAVVGAMPEGEENGVATVGPGVYVGDGAKIGPHAMVNNNVKGGEEQW